jgi:hypothetical protein
MVHVGKMRKSDFVRLEKYGLVDCKDGYKNGFANASREVSSMASSSYWTIIKVARCYYATMYVSGCFYPIWVKLLVGGTLSRRGHIGNDIRDRYESVYQANKDGSLTQVY